MEFLAGVTLLYKGFFEDMKIVIMGMASPLNADKLLFDEFVAPAGEEEIKQSDPLKTVVLKSVTADLNNYYKQQAGQSTSTESGMAHDVTETMEVEQVEENELSGAMITEFWKNLSDLIQKQPDQGAVSPTFRMGENLLGLLLLHCLKLITRTPSSVHRSIATRLEKHFRAIYRPEGWTIAPVPPHFKSLEQLHIPMSAQDPAVMSIVTLLLSKLVLIQSSSSSSISIKGLLYGSCLTHIGMHGLAPIKHLEQASSAVDKTTGAFADMICTQTTQNSLTACVNFLVSMHDKPTEVSFLKEKYTYTGQVTWQFCRLYDQSHFSRFRTKSNTRLIIRCAAFLAVTDKGPNIRQMSLLTTSPNNLKIFDRELAIARRYWDEQVAGKDEATTAAASKLYTGSSMETVNPFN